MIDRDPGVAWRTVFTAASFCCFGVGSLLLGLCVLPAIHLTAGSRRLAQARSRGAVRGSFRLFIWFMRATGVLEYVIRGNPAIPGGTLVVANHPSLIDVIFILAFLPDAICVVKDELGRNPFTRLIVPATGYLTNRDPLQLIRDCVDSLQRGGIIVLFPEGTRTVSGQPLTFKRAAGNVINHAHCPTTPIFLNISPPTLAKGEPWLRVPAQKVRYSMEIGSPLAASLLLDPNANDRRNARICTDRLRNLFLRECTTINEGDPDDDDGTTHSGHQGPHHRFPRT